jgi:hypothetical protein
MACGDDYSPPKQAVSPSTHRTIDWSIGEPRRCQVGLFLLCCGPRPFGSIIQRTLRACLRVGLGSHPMAICGVRVRESCSNHRTGICSRGLLGVLPWFVPMTLCCVDPLLTSCKRWQVCSGHPTCYGCLPIPTWAQQCAPTRTP